MDARGEGLDREFLKKDLTLKKIILLCIGIRYVLQVHISNIRYKFSDKSSDKFGKKKFQQIQHVITHFNSTILCRQSLREVNVSSADPCIQRPPRSGIRPM